MLTADIINTISSGEKKSNLEIIIDYFTNEQGTVMLTELQQELKTRWEMAHGLIISEKYKPNEIAMIMRHRWNYGISAARSDIQNAITVFGGQLKANKKFHAITNIDFLKGYLIELKRLGCHDEAIKVAGILTRAIEALPDEDKAKVASNTVIINISSSQANELSATPIEEAEIIETLNENGITPPNEEF